MTSIVTTAAEIQTARTVRDLVAPMAGGDFAVSFAGLFAAFMRKNAAAMTPKAGETPEQAADAAMVAFRQYIESAHTAGAI